MALNALIHVAYVILEIVLAVAYSQRKCPALAQHQVGEDAARQDHCQVEDSPERQRLQLRISMIFYGGLLHMKRVPGGLQVCWGRIGVMQVQVQFEKAKLQRACWPSLALHIVKMSMRSCSSTQSMSLEGCAAAVTNIIPGRAGRRRRKGSFGTWDCYISYSSTFARRRQRRLFCELIYILPAA
jgi:hypothetical protein